MRDVVLFRQPSYVKITTQLYSNPVKLITSAEVMLLAKKSMCTLPELDLCKLCLRAECAHQQVLSEVRSKCFAKMRLGLWAVTLKLDNAHTQVLHIYQN